MRAWYRVVRGIASGILRVLLAREVSGLEHVPRAGGVILASNHGSFWDPPVLGVCLPRELGYMARASLFRVPVFGALIRSLGAFPVRKGTADLSGLRAAENALARGDALLLFPEGGRMKDGRLHPPLPGLGLIAARARVPIVPVYVSGTNRIRSCMVRRTKVRVTVGTVLPPETWFPEDGEASTLAGRALYQAISDRVMQEIALLRQQQEESTRSGAAPATSTSHKATSHERGGST
jgi:1-acyl-sn-glycerol-3-phosphate acyltransferase